ncbi:MAG: alanine racemase [Verrucomicrobiota bacterium]|nr:alanine racemase [Verrucomicrobiota bacterium]
MIHRCWAEIDLAALRHNAAVARRCAGEGVQLLAVIKANGYGHGLAAVAKALTNGAQLFGVANVEEAIETRGVAAHPVLILGPALPSERKKIVEHQFIPSVSSFEEARQFSEIGPVALNFKIDTGMGRMGAGESEAIVHLQKIAALKNISLHSISTHLPTADEDVVFTKEQLQRFQALVRQIRQTIPGSYKIHASPSAGILGYDIGAFDIVRAGLMLYGVSPAAQLQNDLRPALALKSRVVLLRDLPPGSSISYGRTFITQHPTRVATLSIGYADGYPRAVSNRGAAVLIHGRRCPVLGRITMDLMMVDVTDVAGAEIGDEAVLIGRLGDEEISAREVAERASTIAWEIFSGIGSRVARVYL